MTSALAAFGIHDDACGRFGLDAFVAQPRVHESGVIAVRHEADFVALVLLRHRQIEFFGQRAHFGLRHLAQRKHRARKLRLRQAPEEIRLVFRDIDRRAHFVAARFCDSS